MKEKELSICNGLSKERVRKFENGNKSHFDSELPRGGLDVPGVLQYINVSSTVD